MSIELFQPEETIREPLNKTERRNVEVWLCYDHLKHRGHTPVFIFDLLSNAFWLTPESKYLWNVLAQRDQKLIDRYDTNNPSIVFQIITKNKYHQYYELKTS